VMRSAHMAVTGRLSRAVANNRRMSYEIPQDEVAS
jgi:hypothetical protein